MKSFLNASEIAKLLNVDRATVTRWAKNGQLKGSRRVEGKQQWHIPLSTYEELVKQQSKNKT